MDIYPEFFYGFAIFVLFCINDQLDILVKNFPFLAEKYKIDPSTGPDGGKEHAKGLGAELSPPSDFDWSVLMVKPLYSASTLRPPEKVTIISCFISLHLVYILLIIACSGARAF